MASNVNVLPTEVWVQVMEYVPPKDLCSVVLTSQHMNSLASTQKLWAGTKISKEKVMRDGVTQLFRINRFKKIKAIDLSSMGAWATDVRIHNLLMEIPQTPLEQVDLSGNRMSSNQTNGGVPAEIRELVTWSHGVSAEVLAQGVAHLKSVDLMWTSLTTIQSSKLLEASISADSLETVNLRGANLGGVPADLLAKAVCRLQSVNLGFTGLTSQQLAAMLEASLLSNSLEKVELERVNLSRVPASLLAKAICRLQTVNLGYTRLTGQQSTKIVEASLSSETLVEVNLDGVNLSIVPSEVLAKAVGRLQSVNLSYAEMTRNQWIAVCKAVVSSTSLRQADLRIDGGIRKHLPAKLIKSLKLKDYVQI